LGLKGCVGGGGGGRGGGGGGGGGGGEGERSKPVAQSTVRFLSTYFDPSVSSALNYLKREPKISRENAFNQGK